MSISFYEIPADNLVPMFMTEFDNSNAAKGGAMPWKNLLIGQALSANSANTGTLKLITSDEQADALYGAGSQIARMIRAFRKNTRNSEPASCGLLLLPMARLLPKAKSQFRSRTLRRPLRSLAQFA